MANLRNPEVQRRSRIAQLKGQIANAEAKAFQSKENAKALKDELASLQKRGK